MNNNKLSLFQSVMRIIFCIIGFVSVLMLVNGAWFYHSMRKSLALEQDKKLSIFANDIHHELGNIYDILQEIVQEVSNTPELYGSNSMSRYLARRNIYQFLGNRIKRSYMISALFCYSDVNDISLIQYRNNAGWEKAALEDMIRFGKLQKISYQADNWSYIQADNLQFCYLMYHIDGFNIGAVVNLENMYHNIGFMLRWEADDLSIMRGSEILLNYSESGLQRNERHRQQQLEKEIAGTDLTLRFSFVADQAFYMTDSTFVILIIMFVCCILGLLWVRRFFKRTLIQPVDTMLQVMNAVENGEYAIRMAGEGYARELEEISRHFNEMLDELMNLRIREYEQRLKEKDWELWKLRGQLKPHFYLNALMTINSMTYQDRNKDIREYLLQLSSYMRYMMDANDEPVCLYRELEHIESYVKMQEIKYPSRIFYCLSCPDMFKSKKIPRLLLHTVVENVFKHALRAEETLFLTIQCERVAQDDFDGLCIIVEDNGDGFSDESIRNFQSNREIDGTTEHIGLGNIRRTLENCYGRSDLLRLMNQENGGARVEIWIP